jgi:hypothetical protein
VSSQRSLSPAREAAFRVGPLGDASSARGGAGGAEARRHVAQRRGWGGGEAVTHPGRRGIGVDLLGQRDAAVSESHLLISIIAVAV